MAHTPLGGAPYQWRRLVYIATLYIKAAPHAEHSFGLSALEQIGLASVAAWTFSGSEPSGFRACKVPLAASTWRRWMKLRKKWNQSQGQCQVYKSQTFGESDYHVAHQTDWFTAILMYLQNTQHSDILLAIISMHHTQDQLFTVARFVFHLGATTKAPIRFPQMYF